MPASPCRSYPQSSLPSLTAAGRSRGPSPPPQPRLSTTSISTSPSPCQDADPQVLRLCGQLPSVLLDPPRSADGEPPWPDPQRGRGGRGGYPASAPPR